MFKESQTVTELKESIHSLVNESKSVVVLKKVEKELKKKQEEDWWDELPVEQQKKITKALKDAKEEKNMISHTELKKNLAKAKKKWLAKL